MTTTLGGELKPHFRIVAASGQKIKDLVKHKNSFDSSKKEKSIVYEIPCGSCNLTYVGETHRGLEIRLREHERDLRLGIDSNSLVIHREKFNHLPKIKEAKIIGKCENKNKRKLLESVFILSGAHMNTRESSHKIPPMLAKLLQHELRKTSMSGNNSQSRPAGRRFDEAALSTSSN